jgi:hypothetical protein
MKGSIHFRKDRGIWFVAWYDIASQKRHKVYRYKCEYMYDRKIAEKLLALMQGDVENRTFRIEKYTQQAIGVVNFLREWYETIKDTLSPATQKDYRNSIEKHLVLFLQEEPLYRAS